MVTAVYFTGARVFGDSGRGQRVVGTTHATLGTGFATLLNSHLLQEVEMVCDHVAILSRGQLKYVGSIDEFTQADERFVSMELHSTEQAVRSCLEQHSIASCESVGEKTKVALEINNQAEVSRAPVTAA